jgi:hypothetical protein
MVDLKRIRRGVQKRPPRVLVYGFDGIGKTRYACGAPGALVLDANKGSDKFDVERVDITSWDDVKQWLDGVERGHVKLQNGKPIETLVIDSITDLETMSHAAIFPPNETCVSFKGGYGKGDEHAIMEWRPVVATLERIWLSGKGLVLIAHARVRHFEDPSGPPYDRFEVACRPPLAGMLRQFVDYVLFCREDVGHVKDLGVVTTGTRWMYTRRTPAYDAKARASYMFPERVLLSWPDFQKAVDADGNKDELELELTEMLTEIGDAGLDGQVREFLKHHPAELVQTRNRVSARLDEFRRQKVAQTGSSAGQPTVAAQ